MLFQEAERLHLIPTMADSVFIGLINQGFHLLWVRALREVPQYA
jgi:hypothetical protein